MNGKALKDLADAAAEIAARGAVEYLTRRNLQADPQVLAERLQHWLKIKLPEALKDAEDAFACHMDQVACTTFGASMILAGCEAAKECGSPRIGRGASMVEVEP